MRMCAVTRQVRPIDELIRFVVSPAGEVVADLKRKLPGRGLWVSASREAVAEAVRRNQFSKGSSATSASSADAGRRHRRLLVRSAIEALAMAAKAGQVVAGFAKVEDALQAAGQAGQALIHASGRRRRRNPEIGRHRQAKCRELTAKSPEFPVVTALTSEQLDLALGRSNVIHAALLAGPASKTFLSRSQILVRYRMADDDKTAGQSGQEF